jgi:hypothetical protein
MVSRWGGFASNPGDCVAGYARCDDAWVYCGSRFVNQSLVIEQSEAIMLAAV